MDKQTAEDWETISLGTHIRVGVIGTAKGDVRLHNQSKKEVAFHTFRIQAYLLQ